MPTPAITCANQPEVEARLPRGLHPGLEFRELRLLQFQLLVQCRQPRVVRFLAGAGSSTRIGIVLPQVRDLLL